MYVRTCLSTQQSRYVEVYLTIKLCRRKSWKWLVCSLLESARKHRRETITVRAKPLRTVTFRLFILIKSIQNISNQYRLHVRLQKIVLKVKELQRQVSTQQREFLCTRVVCEHWDPSYSSLQLNIMSSSRNRNM